jgi:hypothetical protein
MLLAVPDPNHGQEMIIEEVAHDVVAGDPLAHTARLVDRSADVRLIDQMPDRAA